MCFLIECAHLAQSTPQDGKDPSNKIYPAYFFVKNELLLVCVSEGSTSFFREAFTTNGDPNSEWSQ